MKNTWENRKTTARFIKLIALTCAALFIATACAVPHLPMVQATAATTTLLGEVLRPWSESGEGDGTPTNWAWNDYSNAKKVSRETAPAQIPDSVLQMIPLLQAVMRAGWLETYDGRADIHCEEVNGHTLENTDRVWGVLWHVLGRYGYKHPDAVISTTIKQEEGYGPRSISVVSLPESAVRDFMEVCFADYTPEYPMPQSPSEAWIEWFDWEIDFYYEDGLYIYEEAATNYNGHHGGYTSAYNMLITYAGEADGMYELEFIRRGVPIELGADCYHIDLVPAESENLFGFAWRVKNVVHRPLVTKIDHP